MESSFIILKVADTADFMKGERNMNFLNSGEGYSLFNEEANYDTYVDKTLMIQDVYRYATRIKKYICITRPRRFGKSVAANMIAAFFDESTAEKSRRLFERLEIGRLKDEQEEKWLKTEDRSLCWPQQGKHKVIRINMIDLISDKTKSYSDFRKTLNRVSGTYACFFPVRPLTRTPCMSKPETCSLPITIPVYTVCTEKITLW